MRWCLFVCLCAWGGLLPTLAQQPPVLTGVPVSYQLPTDGPLPKTYRVTLAIVDPKNPDWIISQFVAGAPRTVTAANQGKFTDTWDGLDDNFMPVPPGSYAVKGIYMPATPWAIDGAWHSVVPKYAGAGDAWAPALADDAKAFPVKGDPVGQPLGDVDVAANGIGVAYFIYLENAANNYQLDFTRPIGYSQLLAGYGSGSAAGGPCTCTDGKTIWSFSTDGGPKFIYRADQRPFGSDSGAGRRNVTRPESWVTAMAAARDEAAGKSYVYVAQRGRIVETAQHWYVESREAFADKVAVYDGENAKLLAELPAYRPQGLVARGNTLYCLHKLEAGGSVIDTVPLEAGLPKGTWQRHCAVPAEINPFDLEVDSHGRLYLSDSDANKVYQLSRDGKILRTYGKLAAQQSGAYDPQSFMAPEKLATWTDKDGQDRLLVVEMAGPNRLSEWSADGQLLREWVTPQTNANSGYAVDPRHPEMSYLPGQRGWLTRFRVDYATGQWRVNAVYPRVGDGRFADGLARPKMVYANNTAYLAFSRNYVVYRLAGDRWLASAAILTEQEGNARRQYIWRDANGDGTVQEEEYQHAPLPAPPGTLRYHGEMWMDDLSLVAMGQGTRDIWRLAPARFDPLDNPVFEKWEKIITDPIFTARANGTASALYGANEADTSFSSDWAQCVGSPAEGWYVNARGGRNFSANFGAQIKISRYVPDGKGGYSLKWRTGRVALQGNAKPGEMYATIFITPPTNGILSVIDNSRAGCLLFTDEGLYVDTLFPDDRVMGPERGGTYPQPGEFFSGYHFWNRDNDKIYFALGKTQPVLYETVGWSGHTNPVRKLEKLDKTVTISAAQIAAPPEIALFVRGGAGTAKVARFSPAPGGGPALDGALTGWDSAEPVRFQADDKQTVEARCMYDPGHLYLRWHVRLGRPFVAKALFPAEHLFAHERGADIVSFYLQGDVTAKPGPVIGRPGDLRIIFGIFKDGDTLKPVALGLYPKWFGPEKGKPITYTTGQRTPFEHVGLLTQVALQHVLDADGQGFVIAASIPRAVLPPMPAFTGDLRTMANFSANFGGHNIVWWSDADGSASKETYDEPSEARLYPGSWAQASFLGLEKELVVKNWLICGPFGGPGAEKFTYDLGGAAKDQGRQFCEATTYPPDDLKVDLKAVYTGEQLKGYWPDPRQVRWKPAVIEGMDTRVIYGPSAQVWYGATWIYTPEATTLDFRFQGWPQTYFRWFLNGQKVLEGEIKGATERAEAIKTVTLQQGWNQVTMRAFCVGYPPFRAGLVLAGPPEKLWNLKLSGTPPE